MGNAPLLIIVSISVLLNIAFIKFKIEKERYLDATIDSSLLILVMVVFSGSFSALVVGTISSMMISIYLWFSPPKVKNKIDTSSLKSKNFPTQVKSPGSFDW